MNTLITIDFPYIFLYTNYNMKLEYIVNNLTKYENVKQVLKEEFLLSDRLIQKLKLTNQIYLNNQPTKIYNTLNIENLITVNLDFEETSDNILPIKMNLDILYEDDGMLIINKPPFMPVHPSMNHYEDSLSNGVKYYFNSIGLKRKIRPVNRLDKNTSGIVIFAKNEYIQECLIKEMLSNTLTKKYIALVEGILDKAQIIDAPIARKQNSIIERCVDVNGDNAITIIKPLKTFNDYSLIECKLKTGRTHQIRVHMAYIGHSILGDELYGKKSNQINRQALHAFKIEFIHPISKHKIKILAKIPPDINNLTKH